MSEGMALDADTFALWRMDVGTYPDYTTAVDSVGGYDFDDGHSSIAAGPIEDINGVHPWARMTSETIGVAEAFRTAATGGSNATIDTHTYAIGGWFNSGNVSRRFATWLKYTAGGNIGIGIQVHSNGAVSVAWDSGGYQSATSATGVVSSNTWHCVILNVTDVGGGQQQADLYIDGTLACTLTANYPSTGTSRFWVLGWGGHLGVTGTPQEVFEGRTADITVLNRVFSAPEIAAESANGDGNYEFDDYGANTVHHWHFSEPPALIDETGKLHMGPPRIDAGRPVTNVASPLQNSLPPTRNAVHFNAGPNDRFRSSFDADTNAQNLRDLLLAGDYTIEAFAFLENASADRYICGWHRNATDTVQANNSLFVMGTTASSALWRVFWEYTTGGTGGQNELHDTSTSSIDLNSFTFNYLAVVVRNEGATWEMDIYDTNGFVETFTGLTPPDGGNDALIGWTIGAQFGGTFSAAGEWQGNIAEVRISDKRRSVAEIDDSRNRLLGIGTGGTSVRQNPLLVRSNP